MSQQQNPAPVAFGKATRRATPLLVGLFSPAGCGKTYSALRLAEGMRRITGGRIKVIDTEGKRALHYAPLEGMAPAPGQFDFDYFEFRPPYSSLRFLEALREANKTPGPIVVDSLSHEHTGEGGYLDLHDDEVKRLCASGGFKSPYAANFPAYAVPARNRSKLVQGIVTMGLNAVFCFRAKDRSEMVKDGDDRTKIKELGWMPIAGEEFLFEMTVLALLDPRLPRGTPNWNPELPGEALRTKLPWFLKEYLNDPKNPKQLNEETGEKLAAWASGRATEPPTVAEYQAVADRDEFARLEKRRGEWWNTLKPDAKAALKPAADAAKARVEAMPKSPPPPPPAARPDENLDAEPPEEPYGTGDPSLER